MLFGRATRAALGTLLSRLSGLARDVAIAYAFGASASYDAFLIGFFIPQALRQVIGEAGLASAFIPVYFKARARGEGEALARSFLRLLLLVLPVLALAGSFLARVYVPFLAAGFPPEKMRESVDLASLLFPIIIFISLAAFAGALLNAHGRFFLPSLSPAFLNLGMIGGALFLARFFRPPILGLVVGTLAGGAAMVLLLFPSFRKALKPSPAPLLHPDLKEVGRRLLPCLAGLLVVEANTLVDNCLASYLPHGSIATLQYAMRLFQLPLGVLAVSVATAILPALSEQHAHQDPTSFRRTLSQGFLLTAALMVPAFFGLWILAEPVVGFLFQRGAFRAADTLRTAQNLTGYLLGLWAYAMVYVFSRAFYALGQPSLPLLGSFLALLVNIGLDLWWVRLWGTFGLALATGVAGWVDALFLAALLWRRVPGWIHWPSLSRVILAGSLMAGGVWAVSSALRPRGYWAQVLAGVSTGILTYVPLVWAFGLLRALRDEG